MGNSGGPGKVAREAKPGVADTGLGSVATTVAVLLILVFLGMLGFLAARRGDSHWDRLVYLLTGLEALVFAGAGALFGTTIQRGNVTAARQDAQTAREEARTERAKADRVSSQATAGRALSAAVLATAESRARAFGRPDEASTVQDPELGHLVAMARALFREEPEVPPAESED